MPSSIKTALLVFLTVSSLSVAAPIPDNNIQANNAYSGSGGHADGGSVKEANSNSDTLLSKPIINMFSGNAGSGGQANSGDSGRPGSLALSQAQATSGNGTAPGNINDTLGNSYSGTGGQATGGATEAPSGLINVMSGNAGDGGKASSGGSSPLSILAGSSKTAKTWRTTKFTRVIHFRLD